MPRVLASRLSTEGRLSVIRWCLACILLLCESKGRTAALAQDASRSRSGDCGLGNVQRPDTNDCYHLRQHPSTSEEAQMFCQFLFPGGSLLSINSKEEENFIAGLIESKSPSAYSYWLGMSYVPADWQGWTWHDQSPLSYLRWGDGEPKTVDLAPCAYFDYPSMEWKSASSCALSHGVICEKSESYPVDITLPTTPTPPEGMFYGCDSGWVGFGDSCYLVEQEETTWSDAQMYCLGTQARLASIQSEVENHFIWSQLPSDCSDRDPNCAFVSTADLNCKDRKIHARCPMTCNLCHKSCANVYSTEVCNYWAAIGECDANPDFMWPKCGRACGCDATVNEGFWIGLNDLDMPLTYEWSDDTDVTFTPWHNNEPNGFRNRNKGENCVVIHSSDSGWSDEVCAKPSKGFVCEKWKHLLTNALNLGGCANVTSRPDSTILSYSTHCYSIRATAKDWPSARADCEADGGTLAIVVAGKENAFLWAKFYEAGLDEQLWIGLSAKGTDYFFVDGRVPTLTFWTSAHTGTERDSCVSLGLDGYWNPGNCTTPLPYVCQFMKEGGERATTEPPTETSLATMPDCPAGWRPFQDKCYKLFEEGASWLDSQMACQRFGGSLAVVHDADTDQVLLRAINCGARDSQRVWIGLSRWNLDASFVWADSSVFDYQNWAPGRPGLNSKQTCVQYVQAEQNWVDASCQEKLPYMCQIYRAAGILNQQGNYTGQGQTGEPEVKATSSRSCISTMMLVWSVIGTAALCILISMVIFMVVTGRCSRICSACRGKQGTPAFEMFQNES